MKSIAFGGICVSDAECIACSIAGLSRQCRLQAAITRPSKSCTLFTQVSYCSTKCQAKDWKDGHKQVCGL